MKLEVHTLIWSAVPRIPRRLDLHITSSYSGFCPVTASLSKLAMHTPALEQSDLHFVVGMNPCVLGFSFNLDDEHFHFLRCPA